MNERTLVTNSLKDGKNTRRIHHFFTVRAVRYWQAVNNQGPNSHKRLTLELFVKKKKNVSQF